MKSQHLVAGSDAFHGRYVRDPLISRPALVTWGGHAFLMAPPWWGFSPACAFFPWRLGGREKAALLLIVMRRILETGIVVGRGSESRYDFLPSDGDGKAAAAAEF